MKIRYAVKQKSAKTILAINIPVDTVFRGSGLQSEHSGAAMSRLYLRAYKIIIDLANTNFTWPVPDDTNLFVDDYCPQKAEIVVAGDD